MIPIGGRTEVVGAMVVVAVFDGDFDGFGKRNGVDHMVAIHGPLALPIVVVVMVEGCASIGITVGLHSPGMTKIVFASSAM